MLVFWAWSLIVIVPFVWAVTQALKEKRFIDALLQFGVLACVMQHFMMFWSEFYLLQQPDSMMRLTNIVASVLIVPFIYMYVARRLVLLSMADVMLFLTPVLLAFIHRGSINVGTELSDMQQPSSMAIDIFYNKTLVTSVKSQNVVMVVQLFFGLYKLLVLTLKMHRKQYHFSKNTQRFALLALVGVTFSALSFIPENSLWDHSLYSHLFVASMFMVIGTGYVFLALGMDGEAIENNCNEPVPLEQNERFAELRERFEDLLETDKDFFTDNIKLDDVARRLGTNRTYLTQMMRESYGVTFSAYINEMRVGIAKDLLANNKGMKLQDVAWKSGFSSLSTFIKVFKSLTGVTPGEWK